MGLFSRRSDLVDSYTSAMEERSLKRSQQPFPVYGTFTVGDLTPDAAMRVGTVFAAVRLLARTAAQLPLNAFRRTDDGGRERYSGKIADLLASPAPGAVTWNLVAQIVTDLCLWGNSYVGLYRDDSGVVCQLAGLRPAGMTVTLEEGQPSYLYVDQQGAQRLGTADVLHFRDVSNDGIVGMSPISQCSAGLRLEQNLERHADQFALNGGRPSAILRVPGWRSAQGTAPADIRADWEQKFQGSENSGKLLIVTGEEDVQYQSLGMSFSDAEFIAQRSMSKADICAIFSIQSHLLNAPVKAGMHYTSSEQDRLDFFIYALHPILALIQQVLSTSPDLSPARTFVEFQPDDTLLRTDSATRATFYQTMIASGVMSVEECRLREGLSTTPPSAPPRPFPTIPSPDGVLPPAPNDPGGLPNA